MIYAGWLQGLQDAIFPPGNFLHDKKVRFGTCWYQMGGHDCDSESTLRTLFITFSVCLLCVWLANRHVVLRCFRANVSSHSLLVHRLFFHCSDRFIPSMSGTLPAGGRGSGVVLVTPSDEQASATPVRRLKLKPRPKVSVHVLPGFVLTLA